MASIKVGFIGAGNMAEAIVRGLITQNVLSPADIIVSDPSEVRRALLADTFKITGTDDNRIVLKFADVIVLAVKPQIMAAALSPVADAFKTSHLVVSIAAGIRTETLDSLCRNIPSIVRVMPNTPALVGKGVSAICAGPRAGEEHVKKVESLFASVGSTLRVDESQMDAVTAISGSGPAYVFYWMEAMLSAASSLGFAPDKARQLVYETLTGAAALAAGSSETPDVLRAKVTSKGGTTEAAIRTLDEHQVRAHVEAAVMAAAKRSQELSKLS